MLPLRRGDPSLRWFPDERSLLVLEIGPTGRQFQRLDLETGGIRTLLTTPYSQVEAATIAADGQSFLFTQTDPDIKSKKHVMRFDIATRDETSVYE